MTTPRSTALCMLATLALASAAGAAIPFSAGQTLTAAQRPDGVAVGDLNGDGFADIAVATDTLDKVSIFLNDGTGTFPTLPSFSVLTGNGSGPRDLFVTDLNGDGRQDFLVTLHNINTARAFINQGGNVFAAGSAVTVGANVRGGSASDTNADGRLDLFAFANRDVDSFSVVSNANGTLSVVTLASGGVEPRAAALGDLDGDGVADLAVTNNRSRTVNLFRGPAFTAWTSFSSGAVGRPEGIAAGDLNGDGRVDLAVTGDEGGLINFVRVFGNAGTGVFNLAATLDTLAANPGRVLLADLNLDGKLDVTAANEGASSITMFENLGTAGAFAFGAGVPATTGLHPGALAFGNVSGSSTGDILVSNRDANTLSILVNGTAGGTNQPPIANAGPDQTVTDANGSGTEVVTLNGSASRDNDGSIANYRWTEGATVLAEGASPTAMVSLALGTHTITLTVRDNQGATATDTVVITVQARRCVADVDDGSGTGTPDGGITIDDLLYFIQRFTDGC